MKHLILALALVLTAVTGFAQGEPPAPYTKTLMIPKYNLYSLTDSTKMTEANLEKNKNTLFIYFGPDCGHCMVFTKKLIDSVHQFRNTQIIMVSSFELSKIRRFYKDMNLEGCPEILVAKDENYFFISHFGIRQFPSAYLYNTKGKFVKMYANDIDIKKLSAYTKKK